MTIRAQVTGFRGSGAIVDTGEATFLSGPIEVVVQVVYCDLTHDEVAQLIDDRVVFDLVPADEEVTRD